MKALVFGSLLLCCVCSTNAATITIIANTNWSAINTGSGTGGQPNNTDDIIVKNGVTLTVNVAGATCRTLQLGQQANPNRGDGTLNYSAAAGAPFDLTVSGTVTLGDNPRNGSVDMSNGGRLTLQQFVLSSLGAWTPANGTVTLTATNTLPNVAAMGTYNNLTISGAGTTTTLALATTLTGSLTITAGTLDVSAGNLALNVAGDFTNNGTNFNARAGTVTLNGTAAQAFGGSTVTSFSSLTISNTAAAISAATNFNVSGTLTVNANAVLTPAAAVVVNNAAVAGTITGAGTAQVTRTLATAGYSNQYRFTTNTLTNLTVEYAGAAAQTISALTYGSLRMNNASGATLAGNTTVTATFTLTAGIISAGASTMIVGTAGTLAGGSATSYVNGCVRKNYAASTPTFTFPIGDATAYTPVLQAFTSATVVSDLTACTLTPDHPQVVTPIASTGIDATKSVNRYWRLTPNLGGTGTPSGTYSITFTFAAADVDGAANTANFIIERYDGTNWNPAPIGTRTATSTQATGLTLYGDFAIGEQPAGFNATPGAFNIFEASTPANSVLGRIYTNIVGSAVALQVVAVNATRTGVNAAFNTNPITVDVLDARDNSGALTPASNCRPTWFPPGGPAVIFSQSLSPVWTNGRTGTVTVFTAVANAVARRDVRIRVTQGGNVGCSTDRFSIRPTAFTVTSSANNNGTGLGTTVKAGANFSITATALAGYDGTPAVDNTAGMVIGTPTAGTIGGGFGAAPIATGVATGASFTYTEVGNLGLAANAVFDASFTSVDPSTDCTPDFSNSLVGGQYGCKIGSVAVAQTIGLSGFGRFIPDHYFVAAGSTLSNRTAAACAPASTFTYMNEGIGFSFTLQARNSGGAVTQNYAGSYVKLDLATIANLGFGAVSGATNFGSAPSRLDLSVGSAGSFAAGQAAVTATVGITRATAPDNPDGPFASTKIGIAPIDSDNVTARAVDMNVDVDGVGGNDHVQIGANTEIRFGRLRLQNALGSEKLALAVPIETQHWAGTGFATNTLDSCTSLNRSAIELGSYTGSLAPAPNCLTFVQQNPVTFANGLGTLSLAAPTGGVSGSVLLTPNLGGTTTGSYCSAAGVVPTSPATAAGLSYLLGRWNDAADPDANASTNYDDKPTSRAAFGLYGSQPGNFIYFRENF